MWIERVFRADLWSPASHRAQEGTKRYAERDADREVMEGDACGDPKSNAEGKIVRAKPAHRPTF